MEVGIEDCLHIEFEYDKGKYHLKDTVVGKIYFLLVRPHTLTPSQLGGPCRTCCHAPMHNTTAVKGLTLMLDSDIGNCPVGQRHCCTLSSSSQAP